MSEEHYDEDRKSLTKLKPRGPVMKQVGSIDDQEIPHFLLGQSITPRVPNGAYSHGCSHNMARKAREDFYFDIITQGKQAKEGRVENREITQKVINGQINPFRGAIRDVTHNQRSPFSTVAVQNKGATEPLSEGVVERTREKDQKSKSIIAKEGGTPLINVVRGHMFYIVIFGIGLFAIYKVMKFQ